MGVSPEQCCGGSKISLETTFTERNLKLGNAEKREFKTKVSSPRFLTMECMDINCPARVHAYVPRWTDIWVVSDVANHTCQLECISKDHKNLRSPLLARLMYS